jgi:hypothetical protein
MTKLNNCRVCGGKVEVILNKGLDLATNRYNIHTWHIGCENGCVKIETLDDYDAAIIMYEIFNDARQVEDARELRLKNEEEALKIEKVIEKHFRDAGDRLASFPSLDVDDILSELGTTVKPLVIERNRLV